MSQLRAFPFRRPRQERVQGGRWEIIEGVEVMPLPEELPDWDPMTTIHLRRRVTVDLAGVQADCGLGPTDRVRLVASWRSAGSTLRGLGHVHDHALADGRAEVVLEVRIPGTDVARDVSVRSTLLLLESHTPGSLVTPRVPGSLLWSDERTVLLEGIASRFPLELVDFGSTTWLPAGAAWFLEWDPEELDLPLLGSVRLYVNSAIPAVANAIRAANPDAAAKAIAQMIRIDVARTMIQGALANVDFAREPKAFGKDTVGAAVRGMIEVFFDGEDPGALRERLLPGEFDAQLQAKLKFLKEV